MDDQKDPKIYEVGVLVKTEDDLKTVAKFLAERGFAAQGEISAKKIALAYPVKKEKEAIFGYASFSGIPESAKAIEKELSMRHDVLRSLIVVADKPQISRPGGDPSLRRRPASRPPLHASVPPAPREHVQSGNLSNEALEKKIEEILK